MINKFEILHLEIGGEEVEQVRFLSLNDLTIKVTEFRKIYGLEYGDGRHNFFYYQQSKLNSIIYKKNKDYA